MPPKGVNSSIPKKRRNGISRKARKLFPAIPPEFIRLTLLSVDYDLDLALPILFIEAQRIEKQQAQPEIDPLTNKPCLPQVEVNYIPDEILVPVDKEGNVASASMTEETPGASDVDAAGNPIYCPGKVRARAPITALNRFGRFPPESSSANLSAAERAQDERENRALEFLMGVFPDIDPTLLHGALENNRYDVECAIAFFDDMKMDETETELSLLEDEDAELEDLTEAEVEWLLREPLPELLAFRRKKRRQATPVRETLDDSDEDGLSIFGDRLGAGREEENDAGEDQEEDEDPLHGLTSVENSDLEMLVGMFPKEEPSTLVQVYEKHNLNLRLSLDALRASGSDAGDSREVEEEEEEEGAYAATAAVKNEGSMWREEPSDDKDEPWGEHREPSAAITVPAMRLKPADKRRAQRDLERRFGNPETMRNNMVDCLHEVFPRTDRAYISSLLETMEFREAAVVLAEGSLPTPSGLTSIRSPVRASTPAAGSDRNRQSSKPEEPKLSEMEQLTSLLPELATPVLEKALFLFEDVAKASDLLLSVPGREHGKLNELKIERLKHVAEVFPQMSVPEMFTALKQNSWSVKKAVEHLFSMDYDENEVVEELWELPAVRPTEPRIQQQPRARLSSAWHGDREWHAEERAKAHERRRGQPQISTKSPESAVSASVPPPRTADEVRRDTAAAAHHAALLSSAYAKANQRQRARTSAASQRWITVEGGARKPSEAASTSSSSSSGSSSSSSSRAGERPTASKSTMTPTMIRRAIRDSNELKRQYFRLAGQAHNAGDYVQAHKFTQLGNENAAYGKMALALLKEEVQSNVDIDLHCLSVHQAIDVLYSVLSFHKRSTGRQIRFITGRGAHSEGGVAKIKQATVQLLKNNGYRFRVFEGHVVVET